MTPDDMARELRTAGWERYPGTTGWWGPLGQYRWSTLRAWERMKELAQQRAQGTVTTPVVGEEG